MGGGRTAGGVAAANDAPAKWSENVCWIFRCIIPGANGRREPEMAKR